MQTLFNNQDYNGILARINQLRPDMKPVWGKMDPSQALAHLHIALSVATGDRLMKRSFLGYVLGPMVKKGYLTKPFPKNSPTDNAFIVTTPREFEAEKAKIFELLKRFHEGGEKGATKNPHSFFGEFTPQQWGETQWKHFDHHLRQFGV